MTGGFVSTIPKYWFVAILILLLASCGSKENQEPLPLARITKYSDIGQASGENEKSPKARMVIKIADLNVEVKNYDETFSAIQKIVSSRTGFIVSSSTTVREERKKSGSIKIRIPSKSFDETLQELKNLANKVENENIKGNDVTEEFYDVDARLQNKQKAELRYYEILKSAKSTKDILEVEKALTDVREEIERLTARKRYLSDQVDLSSINIEMHEPYSIIVTGNNGFWSKLVSGFQKGIDGFGDVIGVGITIVIAISPILLIAFVVIIISIKYYRKRKLDSDK
jgi:hypothetical protein